MKLYLLTQDENHAEGTFESCVVVAEDEEAARKVHPFGDWDRVDVWCYEPESVTATYLGDARKDLEKAGFALNIHNVICGSFS